MNQDTWQRLGDLIARTAEQKKVPGVAVGIFHEGEAIAAGWGVTSVENPLPVTAGTLFQVGSITKTFTATAIMRLANEGRLDLKAPVRNYLPGFRVQEEEAGARATLWHLLTHMGGWAGDFFHGTGQGDDALARYVADMAGLPQLAPIGSHWSYNNAGFSLAGRVVERVTGQTFEVALKELILEPLGLARSFFDPGQVISHRFVVGHTAGDDGPAVARPWPLERSAYPAGGLVCDVPDLLRYARFHLGEPLDGSQAPILPAESLARMQTPQVTIWGGQSRGLAWAIDDWGEVRQISHGGGTKGQVSLLALVPQRRFALVALTNAEHGGQLTEAVQRWALREYLGIEVPRPQAREAMAQELAPYAGCYWGDFDDVELGLLGGKLVGQRTFKRAFPNEDTPPWPAPSPMSLKLCEEDRLLVLDGEMKGATADVLRRPDGRIGWLRFSGRLHVRQD